MNSPQQKEKVKWLIDRTNVEPFTQKLIQEHRELFTKSMTKAWAVEYMKALDFDSTRRQWIRFSLLSENPVFQREWATLRLLLPLRVTYLKSEDKKIWLRFCRRWGIFERYEGHDRTSLLCNLLAGPDIFFRTDSGRIRTVSFSRLRTRKKGIPKTDIAEAGSWPKNIQNEPRFIYVKITPETDIEEIKTRFWAIDILKKRVWGESKRNKPKFDVAMCWWRLRNEPQLFGASPRQKHWTFRDIAKMWNEGKNLGPREKVSPSTVSDAIYDIQRQIRNISPLYS